MKIRTRIAAAVTVALASLFIASPALASGDGEAHVDQFSHAGEPLQVYAILTVGLVLLVIVLAVSALVGRLFDQKK